MQNQDLIIQEIIAKQAEINALFDQLKEASPHLFPRQNKLSARSKELDILALFGITGQVAQDFIILRKAKKAPITETAIKRLYNQSLIAGISAKRATEICIERNWQGFMAEWYLDKDKPKSGNPANWSDKNTSFHDSLMSEDF